MRRAITALSLVALTLGCSASQSEPSATDPSPAAATTSAATTTGPTTAAPRQAASRAPTRTATPRPTMNARAALRDIRHLATEIGPREATSPNFAEAAAFVENRFEGLG